MRISVIISYIIAAGMFAAFITMVKYEIQQGKEILMRSSPVFAIALLHLIFSIAMDAETVTEAEFVKYVGGFWVAFIILMTICAITVKLLGLDNFWGYGEEEDDDDGGWGKNWDDDSNPVPPKPSHGLVLQTVNVKSELNSSTNFELAA